MLGVLNLLPRVLISVCRSRRELILENLVLRHQLEVHSRAKPKVRLRAADRVLWVWLRRVWLGGWADHLRIVRPATVMAGIARVGCGVHLFVRIQKRANWLPA